VRVLIISEGPTDEYMLKPIIQAMMAAIGKSQAIVRFSPITKRRQGIREALKVVNIQQIIKANPMVQLFLLCVDRDGEDGRKQQLTALEQEAKKVLPIDSILLAENAWQEIEVWVLAGQLDLPSGWRWQALRAELHAKERYFEPYAKLRGLSSESPGEGRRTLAEEAAGRYSRIRRRCSEVKELEDRVTVWLLAGS
jgi:hypothetical protein